MDILMNKLYSTLALVTGAALVSLGAICAYDIKPLKENPYKDKIDVCEIIALKREAQIVDQEFRQIANNASPLRRIYSLDDNRRILLEKLNAPDREKEKLLVQISDSYWKEYQSEASTNENWQAYREWNSQTNEKNKSRTFGSLLALLSGAGLIFLSRNKKVA
jgi:flagellar biosynthesis/type III secretory pathway chaperone